MNFIISAIVILCLGILSERYLRKKFDIEKRKGFIYKGANKFHRWTEGSLLIIVLILLWFFIEYTFLLLISFYVLMNLFRALMEWRYERENKEYILTLHSIIIYLLLIGSFSLFNLK